MTESIYMYKNMNVGNGGAKSSFLKKAIMYKEQGNSCYRKGKYKKAISLYDQAIEECRDSTESNKQELAIFYQNRAAAYEMLKMWSEVKADCSKSLEYNPFYAKAYFRRAKAHEIENNLLDCLDDLSAAIVLGMAENEKFDVCAYRDRIAKIIGEDAAAKDIATREHDLPSVYTIKNYFKSFLFDPVHKKTPKVNDPKGYIRAKMAFESENYDEVISACSVEIDSSGTKTNYKAEALILRGSFHILSGNFKDGTLDLNAVINAKVMYKAGLRANALIKRGYYLHFQLGDKELAIVDFSEAEKICPNNPDLYSYRGLLYLKSDQISDALREFKKAVEISPNHANAYLQKCSTEYSIAKTDLDYALVINEMKKAIDKFPDYIDCYTVLAKVLSNRYQFSQANSLYWKAIDLSPKTGILYVYLGKLLLKWTGDVDGSILLIQKAIDLDPKCILAYLTLEEVQLSQCACQTSILLRKAISLCKLPMAISYMYAKLNTALALARARENLGMEYC